GAGWDRRHHQPQPDGHPVLAAGGPRPPPGRNPCRRAESTRREFPVLRSPLQTARVTVLDLARVESMPAGVVSQTTLRVLAAELGSDSPLPPFSGLQRLPDPSSSPDLPLDMRERIAYGRLANPLPYPFQNDYRRELAERKIAATQSNN